MPRWGWPRCRLGSRSWPDTAPHCCTALCVFMHVHVHVCECVYVCVCVCLLHACVRACVAHPAASGTRGCWPPRRSGPRSGLPAPRSLITLCERATATAVRELVGGGEEGGPIAPPSLCEKRRVRTGAGGDEDGGRLRASLARIRVFPDRKLSISGRKLIRNSDGRP